MAFLRIRAVFDGIRLTLFSLISILVNQSIYYVLKDGSWNKKPKYISYEKTTCESATQPATSDANSGKVHFCSRAVLLCTATVHRSCTGIQGPPLALYSSFLGQQGLQATFLLFQNFERVQQTSSHLVGLAPLKMLIMQEKVSQYHICSLDHLFLSHHCSRFYCHWNQGAFAKCSSIDIYQRQLDF